MTIYFDLRLTSAAQFMFSLNGAYGEIVLTSERYLTRQGAHRAIDLIKVNAHVDARYYRLTTPSGFAYFTFTGANGEVIGTSETYTSTTARDNGISWVKQNAPGAPTDDNT